MPQRQQSRAITLVDPEAAQTGRNIDAPGAERAAAELLVALGTDLTEERVRETPRRMVPAYTELLTSQPFRHELGSWGPDAIDRLVAPHRWHLPYGADNV